MTRSPDNRAFTQSPAGLIHIDVCSGIGGFSLAAEMAGFTTALHCEIEPYCRRVLAKHFPEVPIHDDLRTLTADVVAGLGIGWVDLLTGGVPCQPRSIAGKRRGAADDRDLWPEMRRLVAELQPRSVVVEQPPGVLSMGIEDWVADLEAEGYETGIVVLPAAAVGAPHIRDRVFILADACGLHPEQWGASGDVAGAAGTGEGVRPKRQWDGYASVNCGAALAHADEGMREGRLASEGEKAGARVSSRRNPCADGAEPRGVPGAGVGRDVDGLSARLDPIRRLTWPALAGLWPALLGEDQHDWEPLRVSERLEGQRLQALGNAVVPAQAVPILQVIADWMRLESREEAAS